MRFISRALLLSCLLVALRPTSLAQNNAASPPVADGNDDEVVRVNTNLVSLTASVRDRDGRFVTDLRQEDFIVLENGVRQQLSHFAPVEQPFSVVLLLDTSGSTRIRLRDIQDSAIAFIEQLRPHDRVIPLTFDNKVVTLLPDWASDRDVLRRAILSARTGIENAPSRTVRVKGFDKPITLLYIRTRLYEAVHRAAELLAPVKGRKAVILLTDGFDTGERSSVTFKSTLREAEELGALIYPVQYCDCEIKDARERWSAKWVANEYMESLAKKSGGRFYRAENMKKIERAFASIAEELRHTYSLGYYPTPSGQTGGTRQVKIKVTRPKLVVREGKTYVYQREATR